MHLVLLFCICYIPSAQSTFGPFMIGFFRARDALKAGSEAAAASRESSRDTLHLFLGQLPQTLQREVSPFTRSRL